MRVCSATVAAASFGTSAIVVACFLAIVVASSVSAYVMYAVMKKRIAPRDLKSIGSPCFDSFPNQYSSLPTKDDRPKVKRQTSFNGGGVGVVLGMGGPTGGSSGGGGLLGSTGNGSASGASSAAGGSSASAKLLANGTLTKSNNVTGHQTPKVLAKGHFVDVDTATIKRNSHALNNVRPLLRSSAEDDKF